MNDFKKQFAKNLRELRELAGFTQEQLAERVGVATKTLSYWENGHNSITFAKIPVIASALEVPVYRLFTFDKYENIGNISDIIGIMNKRDREIILKIIKLMSARTKK